jgi:hypothetical protein
LIETISTHCKFDSERSAASAGYVRDARLDALPARQFRRSARVTGRATDGRIKAHGPHVQNVQRSNRRNRCVGFGTPRPGASVERRNRFSPFALTWTRSGKRVTFVIKSFHLLQISRTTICARLISGALE